MSKHLLYCLLILTCLGCAFGQDTSRPTRPIDDTVHPISDHSCDCCGKKPHYDANPAAPAPPYPWSQFTGQVAILTQQHSADPGPLPNQSVVIFDLSNL